jgi:tetratricopeptide (TPR) repeat protein
LSTSSNAVYYCSGDLSVSADGAVKYDCTQTDDPSGRCDHVSIPAGYLKEARIGSSGSLHLVSKGQGNLDFFGDRGTLKAALAAITPLVGVSSMASTRTIVPPPKPPAGNCSDYEACMKKGDALLEQSNGGSEALGDFEKASQLEPSKGEPVAGKGYAYLEMGQYDNAVYTWDSALKLGATLSSPVCHAGMACGDTGEFLLSLKEVSFVNKKSEKKFSAPPTEVTSDVGAPNVIGGNGRTSAYYVQLVSSGKNYRFYYTPRALQCRSNFLCAEPGLSQQKVFADYVHNTLEKLRAGSFASQSK